MSDVGDAATEASQWAKHSPGVDSAVCTADKKIDLYEKRVENSLDNYFIGSEHTSWH